MNFGQEAFCRREDLQHLTVTGSYTRGWFWNVNLAYSPESPGRSQSITRSYQRSAFNVWQKSCEIMREGWLRVYENLAVSAIDGAPKLRVAGHP